MLLACRAAAAEAAAAAPAAAAASKKRTPEDTSYDALSYLLTSLRTFYMGTAKAIHTPVRRRDEPTAPPSVPMKAAALNLALLLVGNLQLRPWQQQQPDSAAAEASSSGAKQQLDAAIAAVRGRSGHYLRLAEELAQVLFDSRRHYCHLLVLNYFSALGGMQVLAACFNDAAELLWGLMAAQEAAKAAAGPAAAAAGAGCSFAVQLVERAWAEQVAAAAELLSVSSMHPCNVQFITGSPAGSMFFALPIIAGRVVLAQERLTVTCPAAVDAGVSADASLLAMAAFFHCLLLRASQVTQPWLMPSQPLAVQQLLVMRQQQQPRRGLQPQAPRAPRTRAQSWRLCW